MPSGAAHPQPSLPAYAIAIGRCVQRLPDLVAATSPVGWPSLGSRLALEADLADAHGARRTAARKRDWLRFIGIDAVGRERLLAEVHGPDDDPRIARRRAAIAARIAVSAEVDHATDVIVGGNQQRPALADLVSASLILSTSGLFRVGSIATVSAARWLHRRAPELPPVERYAHRPTNLLTELVAESIPALLSSVPARMVVHVLPSPVVVGIRSGRLATTVSVGSDVIRVRNGISRHVTLLLHSGAEPFLRRAAVRLEQEAAGLETH